MDINIFKQYKPQAYDYIKTDYGIDDQQDDDSDISLPTIDDIFNGKLKSFSTAPSGGDQAGTSKDACFHDGVISNMKSLFSDMSKNLKQEIDKKKTSLNVSSVFRCFICFESNPAKFMVCFTCGRFLGCYGCVSKLDDCPICRTKFQCTACGTPYPKNPLFVPGLADFIDRSSNKDSDSAEE